MAATTYANLLIPYVSLLPRRTILVEIGAGTGEFLSHMENAGFQQIIGIEPSLAAIQSAKPAVRPKICPADFDPDSFVASSISMICCFQTLEHVPDPRELI